MRLRDLAILVCLIPVTGWGCYAYSMGGPDRLAPGGVVEITLNDLGRFRMAGNIGPEVMAVQGVVASVSDSEFVLQVLRVTGIDGSFSTWAREPATFNYSFVRGYRERRFSTGRTAALAGGMTASIVAFIATRSLTGLFGGDRGGPGGTGDPPGGVDH